jgi:putative transcriptional regulator
MYHYLECGLDNVFLFNGYTIHETDYGTGVSIENSDQLHELIASSLIKQAHALNGAEFRFLRLEMDLSQARMAVLLGVKELTVLRWERARSKPLPGMADRLIRVIYADFAIGEEPIRSIVEKFAQLESVEHQKIVEWEHGWRVKDETCSELAVA